MKKKFLKLSNLVAVLIWTAAFLPIYSSAQSCGLAGSISGTTITYNFEGKLNEPFGTLTTGTPFHGTLIYNASQSNIPHGQPNYRGDYVYNSLSITFGSTTITDYGTGVINLYDHGTYDGTYTYPTDLFHVYTFNVSGTLGGKTLAGGAGIQLVLQDISGTALTGIGLPDENLTMGDVTPGNATFIEIREANSGGFSMPASARGNLSVCPPVANCKNITVQLDNNGTVNITGSQVNNGSTSSVGIQSLTVNPNSFDCSDIGTNTVVLTVTDNNNNTSTCTSTVTVQCTAPSLNLTGDYTDLYTYGGNFYNASGVQVTSVDINSTVSGQCTGYDFLWSVGATGTSSSFTITTLAVGTTDYTLTVSKNGSCPTTKTWRLCIHDIQATTNKVYVCYQGQTLSANVMSSCSSPNSYCWLMAHGATLGACNTGTCGGLQKRTEITKESIINNNTELSVNVFPNPNTGQFSVDITSDETGQLKLSVIDLMGRVVHSMNDLISGNASVPVNLSTLPEGQYIIKAEINGHILLKKVMLVK